MLDARRRCGIRLVRRSISRLRLSITEVYLTYILVDSQVALCVYDITNKNSFDVLKNWVKELQSEGPKDLILAVVGNKTDKVDHEEVPYESAKNYAKSVGALFKLTSAKEGKGINVKIGLL